MKYLTTAKTSTDILVIAAEVWRQFRAGVIPVIGDVRFESVLKLGACEQNIRELIEGTVYGEEMMWPQRGCCAGSTCRNIRNAGYPTVAFVAMEPGDLVYMSGGKKCSTCGGEIGRAHV